MDTKTWLAFLTGLVVAGGATYMFTHRESTAAPEPPTLIVKTVAPPPAPDPMPAPHASNAETKAKIEELIRTRPEAYRRIELNPPSPAPAPVAPAPAAQAAASSSNTTPASSNTTPASSTTPAPEPISQPFPLPVTVPEIALNASGPTAKPTPAPIIQPPPSSPNTVTIDKGALVNVRVQETLSSDRNKAGDTFSVTLDDALVAGGFVIAERGAHGEGEVIEVQPPGKATGAARLVIVLTRIETSDGQNIAIRTETITREGSNPAKGDAVKIAAGAAAGAAIGAAADGGKGAAIGAGAGTAAGAGAVLLTRAKHIKIPSESKISFRVSEPVTVTERQ